MKIIELKLFSILGTNYPKLLKIIVLCLDEEMIIRRLGEYFIVSISSLLILNFSIIKQNTLFPCIQCLIYLLLFPFRPLFFLQDIEIVESFGNIKDFA